ncbi:hypothetical protein KKC16_02050, partial [Patescibacteria group bacterium]|nr:hypothetical protein [Patescibacteria group bacterium]
MQDLSVDQFFQKHNSHTSLDDGYFLLYDYSMNKYTIKFITSKKRETERLVDLFAEYRWFVENDFPIVLPKITQSIKDDL